MLKKFIANIRFAILFGALLMLVSVACTSEGDSDTPALAATETTADPTSTPVPPSASFSVDVESGSAPLLVTFVNTSRGPATSLEWDFGDGTTSTDASPSHGYTVAGSHDVTLTVSGPGGTDTSSMTGLITVQPGPPVGLQISPPSATLAVQEVAQFTASVVDEFGNASPSAAKWTIAGDGGSIADDGRFTAGIVADTFNDTVTASFQTDKGELVAAASVSVEAGPVAQVSVEPTEAVLGIGGSQPFTVMVLDEYGNQVHDFLSSWSVSPEVGAIDANGVFIPGTKAGLFLDTVRVDVVKGRDGASATADVAIQPDPLATIEIEPSFADVENGASQTFAAAAFDQFGNNIDGLVYLWEGTGGEITRLGRFTALEQWGRYEVRASASFKEREATGSATVYIPSSLDRYINVGYLLEEAHAFAEPIQAAVSKVPPDFQDDFAAAGRGWTSYVVPGTIQGTMETLDGVLRISELIGQIIINGGAWTRSKDFVLELDVRLAQGDYSSIQKFFFHSAGDNYFNIHLTSGEETWKYLKDTGDGGRVLEGGSGGSPVGETTHYMAVVRGVEAVIYLNNEAILYLNDPDLDRSGLTTFGCQSIIETVCEFDNVKYWNLANVPNLP